MRMTRIVAIMIAMLLANSLSMTVENSGSTEVLPEPCPDLSDLNPQQRQRIPVPYSCQVFDDGDPVPQSNEATNSSVELSGIGMKTLSWLSRLRFLVPTIGP